MSRNRWRNRWFLFHRAKKILTEVKNNLIANKKKKMMKVASHAALPLPTLYAHKSNLSRLKRRHTHTIPKVMWFKIKCSREMLRFMSDEWTIIFIFFHLYTYQLFLQSAVAQPAIVSAKCIKYNLFLRWNLVSARASIYDSAQLPPI